MRWLGVLAIIFPLAGCVPSPPAQQTGSGGQFEISDNVQADYLRYLTELGTDKDGAFAVSIDGSWSGYLICPTNIASCHAEKNALSSCRWGSNTRECVLAARGRTKKLSLKVVPISAPLHRDDPILAHVMTGDEIRQHLSGASLRGYLRNDIPWTEYYAADGTILGHDGANGSYRGLYKIRDDDICFTYFTGSDWCARLSLIGNRVRHIIYNSRGPELITELRDTELVPGNALTGN